MTIPWLTRKKRDAEVINPWWTRTQRINRNVVTSFLRQKRGNGVIFPMQTRQRIVRFVNPGWGSVGLPNKKPVNTPLNSDGSKRQPRSMMKAMVQFEIEVVFLNAYVYVLKGLKI